MPPCSRFSMKRWLQCKRRSQTAALKGPRRTGRFQCMFASPTDVGVRPAGVTVAPDYLEQQNSIRKVRKVC